MPKNYEQLSEGQRYQIESLRQTGTLQKEIAGLLGKTPSTISRELKRNTPKRGIGSKEYRAGNAQRKTVFRHQTKKKHIRFNEAMKEQCRKWLKEERWSPELISQQGKELKGDFVSHEAIYQWIWERKKSHRKEDIKDRTLYQYLAHGRQRRKRGLRRDSRGIIPNRVSIEKRPSIVERRKRIGDFEIDLMMGKNNKGALLVMTDRATLWTGLKRLPSKSSRDVKNAILKKLYRKRDWIKTATFDNDQAFTLHDPIGRSLQADTFFTHPYTSQEKGTVENRIGVIRRFFPKRTDMTKVTDQKVREVESKINNRPVRKFNYKTPNQVFSEKIALIT